MGGSNDYQAISTLQQFSLLESPLRGVLEHLRSFLMARKEGIAYGTIPWRRRCQLVESYASQFSSRLFRPRFLVISF
jgi:hypothetical protein